MTWFLIAKLGVAKSNLFPSNLEPVQLPVDYGPNRPKRFRFERIVLAKWSDSSGERIRFIEDICRLYPDAEISECLAPHSRIDLQEKDPAKRAGTKVIKVG